MIDYKSYCYNVVRMKVTEGPRGAIFSVWKKVGDALKEVHLESRHFRSESEAEAAARKWIDQHAASA